MAVAFRSISVGLDTSGGGTTTSVTCPTSVQTGDLLLFYGVNDAPSLYAAPPTGLTLIDPNPAPSDAADDVGTGSWYKIATSSDIAGSTSYTVTKAGSANAQPRMLVCVAYSGIDPTAWPLASTRHAYKQGSLTTTVAANTACPTPPNPTSVNATDLVVRVYAFGESAAATGITMTGPPTGWTARGAASTLTNVSSKYNVRALVCDRTGATDTATITANKAGSWDIYTLAVPALVAAPNDFMPFFSM